MVRIETPGGTYQALRVESMTTIQEAVKELCQKVGLPEKYQKGWGLFENNPGIYFRHLFNLFIYFRCCCCFFFCICFSDFLSNFSTISLCSRLAFIHAIPSLLLLTNLQF